MGENSTSPSSDGLCIQGYGSAWGSLPFPLSIVFYLSLSLLNLLVIAGLWWSDERPPPSARKSTPSRGGASYGCGFAGVARPLAVFSMSPYVVKLCVYCVSRFLVGGSSGLEAACAGTLEDMGLPGVPILPLAIVSAGFLFLSVLAIMKRCSQGKAEVVLADGLRARLFGGSAAEGGEGLSSFVERTVRRTTISAAVLPSQRGFGLRILATALQRVTAADVDGGGVELHAVDAWNTQFCQMSQDWLAYNAAAEGLNVAIHFSDYMRLPFGSSSLDVVYIPFLPNIPFFSDTRDSVKRQEVKVVLLLREIARVLKPGGVLAGPVFRAGVDKWSGFFRDAGFGRVDAEAPWIWSSPFPAVMLFGVKGATAGGASPPPSQASQVGLIVAAADEALARRSLRSSLRESEQIVVVSQLAPHLPCCPRGPLWRCRDGIFLAGAALWLIPLVLVAHYFQAAETFPAFTPWQGSLIYLALNTLITIPMVTSYVFIDVSVHMAREGADAAHGRYPERWSGGEVLVAGKGDAASLDDEMTRSAAASAPLIAPVAAASSRPTVADAGKSTDGDDDGDSLVLDHHDDPEMAQLERDFRKNLRAAKVFAAGIGQQSSMRGNSSANLRFEGAAAAPPPAGETASHPALPSHQDANRLVLARRQSVRRSVAGLSTLQRANMTICQLWSYTSTKLWVVVWGCVIYDVVTWLPSFAISVLYGQLFHLSGHAQYYANLFTVLAIYMVIVPTVRAAYRCFASRTQKAQELKEEEERKELIAAMGVTIGDGGETTAAAAANSSAIAEWDNDVSNSLV